MGPATGKEKRGRASRPKLASKIPLKNPQTNPAKPRSKTAKVQKPIGPGTRLGDSKMVPIILESDDEESTQDGSAYGGVYVPGSLISRPLSPRNSALRQDLGRFHCNSNLLSPSPSQTSLYSPISNIFAPPSFILRRTNTAPPVSHLVAVNDEHPERKSYITLPTTIRDDIRERESSPFMSASRPVNYERPTTTQDTRTSKLSPRIKLDTPRPYKFRTSKATSESKPDMGQEAAKTLHLPQLLSQYNSANIGSAGKAVCGSQNARVVRKGDGDEEVMVKVDPNDLDYECDSDATNVMELEIEAERRRLAQIKSKSKLRHTKSTSKVSKSRMSTKSMATKSVRSKRDDPPKMCVTKSSRPSIARKRRRNSIDRDFLMSDNEVLVESGYSSASSSDDGRRSSYDSDVDMKGLEDDCADLRINMTPKYAFNSRILEKQERAAEK